MTDVLIYTASVSLDASTVAGWGAVLVSGEHIKETTGAADESTDRIALIACIEALGLLKKPCTVRLATSSLFVIEGMSQIDVWKQNRWRDIENRQIEHADLWRQMDEVCAQHDTIWQAIDPSDPIHDRVFSLAHNSVSKAISKTAEETADEPCPAQPDHNPEQAGRMVVAYTDGSCLGTPGPGGWAAIIHGSGVTTHLSGGEQSTTNNRMELMAAIQALENTGANNVRLVTDSRYVVDGVGTWMVQWKANGWRNQHNKAIKNGDLWRRIDMALRGKNVSLEWVKGHSGHEFNEQADKLANLEARMIQANIRKPVLVG